LKVGPLGNLGSSLTSTPTTLEFWIKTTYTDAIKQFGTINDGTTTMYVVNFNRDQNDAYSAGRLGLNIRDQNGNDLRGAANVPDLYDGEWHFVSLIGDVPNKTIDIYIDGSLQTVTYGLQDNFTTTVNFQHPFAFGASNGRGTIQNYLDCDLDQIKIYDYARTESQINSDYIAGASILGSRAVFGNDGDAGSSGSSSHPFADNLTGYWRLEEGTGTSTTDLSSAGNDGTISGATWLEEGQYGKALDFDGIDDYILVGTTSRPTDNFSVEAWFTTDVTHQIDGESTSGTGGVDGQKYLFWPQNESSNGGMGVSVGTNGISVYEHGSGYMPALAVYNGTVPSGWNHLVVTYTSKQPRIYLNGSLVRTGLTSPKGIVYAPYKFGGGDYGYHSGHADEIKIYDIALTDEQVMTAYNFSPLADSTWGVSELSEYCVPGDSSTCNDPVGEWLLNGKQGTTATDTSKNGNDGTINGALWGKGKISSALNFNGTSDYIAIPSPSNIPIGNSSYTIQAWIKPSATGTRGIVGWGNYGTSNQSNALKLEGTNQVVNYWWSNDLTATVGTIQTGTWYHVAATYDGTTRRIYWNGAIMASDTPTGHNVPDANNLTIGTINIDKYFAGVIDEVRIYDYARTPAQIAWDYNKGQPVAHWRLDKCIGTTAYDSSGNGYNGEIVIGTSGTQTNEGICTFGNSNEAWSNGSVGKLNSALSFDGTDDYITVPNSFSPKNTISITLSVKTTSTSRGVLMGFSDQFPPTTPSSYVPILIMQDDGRVRAEHWSGSFGSITSTSIVNDGEWHDIVFIGNINTQELYIDGKLEASRTATINNSWWTKTTIGTGYDTTTRGSSSNEWNSFNGIIDEVRIYTYPITQQQILLLRNNDATLRF
jgi:hypothetical protein